MNNLESPHKDIGQKLKLQDLGSSEMVKQSILELEKRTILKVGHLVSFIVQNLQRRKKKKD